ncbi:MAG: S41 family peptidase [Chloroflexi bacterium]|nr:S41 family peptidase [Chloroflexota bacterium]
MRSPKASLWFAIVVGVLVMAAVVASCNLNTGGSSSSSIELPEGIPPEFKTLFEVYFALEEDHLNRDELDATALSQGAIRGMLDALGDVHASYLDPDFFSAELERFRGSFEGIGAEVSMKDGQVVVVAPIPDTPAERAGIRPGDTILEVNGESTQGLGVFEVVARIRGPEGTSVDLLILHRNDSSPTPITITRGVVKVPTVDLRILTGGLAHLKVQFFGENTSKELEDALERVEQFNSKGLILDLRNNPGGRVDTVVEMTSQFLDSGLVLYQIDGQDKRIDYEVKSGGKAQDISMVVLVNDFSASSSEIMAGALRDHGRAQLIGTTTFGKGSVNIQRALSDGSGIYFTIARWYTPNGTLIEGGGIEPDIVVPSDPEGVEDFQLDKAIEVLQGLVAQHS